jgi:hypothetical protein
MTEAFKEQPNPFEKRREERPSVVEEWKQREALRETRISTETPRTKSWGTSELELERWKIEFSVGKSMRYHAYRRAFWESLAQRTKILMLIGGAIVLAGFAADKSSVWGEMAAIGIAVLAALDIVVDFGRRARHHHDLFRNLCSLAKDIAEHPRPTDMEVGRWRAQCLELQISQPGAIGWLDKRCAAEEAVAREVEPKASWLLPGWKLMLSQWAFWST